MSTPSSSVGVAESTFGSHGCGLAAAKRSCRRARSSRSTSAVCSAATMRRTAACRYRLAEPSALGGMRCLVSVLRGEIQTRHITPEFRLGFGHHQRGGRFWHRPARRCARWRGSEPVPRRRRWFSRHPAGRRGRPPPMPRTALRERPPRTPWRQAGGRERAPSPPISDTTAWRRGRGGRVVPSRAHGRQAALAGGRRGTPAGRSGGRNPARRGCAEAWRRDCRPGQRRLP